MINGLRSRNSFKSITRAKTIFGSRGPLLTAIGEAIDEAHAARGKFAQCRALIKIRFCCQAWFNGNPNKQSFKPNKYLPGGEGSHRFDGVTTLAAEIDHLLTNAYRAQFANFKAMMGENDTRIGTREARNLSNDEYVAEFLDPKHRSKASILYTEYQKWDNPTAMSFTAWLGDTTIQSSRDAQAYIDMMYPDSSTNEAKQVTYLDDNARKAYRLEMRGGRYYRPIDNGAPFSTKDHHTGDPHNTGWSIFVMSPSGFFYSHSKDIGKFHHSSFLSGTPTLAAGCLCVDNGVIVGQNNASGHYKPGAAQSLQFVKEVYDDMVEAVGKSAADSYMTGRLRISESFITGSFQGPYYSGAHYLETNGKPTTTASAPLAPT